MDNYIHFPFIQSFPLILLLQDTPKHFPIFRESFVPTALQFLVAWMYLRIIPHTYRGLVHSQLFMCFAKYFLLLFDFPKILCSLMLLKVLHAYIMVNSICPVIFVDIPCHLPTPVINSRCSTIFVKILYDCHSDPIDSTCVRILTVIRWSLVIILPAQTLFWTWAGSRPINLQSIVPLSLFNLSILDQSVCFWSSNLEIIFPLYLSFELFR